MTVYSFIKRFLDILLSLLGIVLLSPLLLVIAVLIRMTSPGPVFFRQKRIGKDRTVFTILKFRTMRVDAPKDVPTHLLADADKDITPIGRFLRKTSLDELPQMFNILAGQMSIIGPRPALWNQDDLIGERNRNGSDKMVPGLTGWAQINGRDELSIPAKAALDGYYAEHFGFRLDAEIFFRSIGSVLHRRGIVEGKQNDKK